MSGRESRQLVAMVSQESLVLLASPLVLALELVLKVGTHASQLVPTMGDDLVELLVVAGPQFSDLGPMLVSEFAGLRSVAPHEFLVFLAVGPLQRGQFFVEVGSSNVDDRLDQGGRWPGGRRGFVAEGGQLLARSTEVVPGRDQLGRGP